MTEEQCITVGTVMTHEVRSIDRMATVRKAIRIMRDTGVSSLAVNRRDAADEFGLLSITDIAREGNRKSQTSLSLSRRKESI